MAFDPPRRIELEYQRAIEQLLARKLEIPAGSTIGEILTRISEVIENETTFKKLGMLFSRRMVAQVRVSNARSWREAARISGRGQQIYKALTEELEGPVGTRVQELVAENAKLISSIPASLRQSITAEIAGLEQQGLRPKEIAEYIRKRVPKLTHSRVELIARTETSKAVTALTQARSEDLGIAWYQWLTASDQRVRPAHKVFEKVLVRWDDPPNPEKVSGIKSTLGSYNAGAAPNCRCVALPLVSLDVISWPAKVYHGGRIERMSRKRFEQFSGMRRAA